MSTLLIALALALSIKGEHDHALIVAIAALVFAVRAGGRPSLLRRWLGWDDAIAKAQNDDA
jgi:hypothetical protein